MSIAMHSYIQQALPKVVIFRTQVVEKKWKLRVRFSPTKENCAHQTNISTKTDKRRFLAYGVQDKIPIPKYLVCCVCVLFSLAKSMLRMGICVCFCCHNILFHRTMRGKGSPRSVVSLL